MKLKTAGILGGITVVLAAVAIFAFAGTAGGNASGNEDIVIVKNEVTETAVFYPLKAGKTNMEILAIKAEDGTVRTAFNTCQICYGSPRAYYKQEGNQLVCQNCGNRFSPDMVEKRKGGCNPIPIMEGDKTDDGTNITITKEFIEKHKNLFTSNWKKV